MFTLRPLTIVLPSREDKEHPAVDLDLHLPFFCFRPQQLLQVSHTPVVLVKQEEAHINYHFSVCPAFCPCLCRCCPVSCRSSGWCYFLLIGPGSRWWQRACCIFCRSVESIWKGHSIFKTWFLLNLMHNCDFKMALIELSLCCCFISLRLKHWLQKQVKGKVGQSCRWKPFNKDFLSIFRKIKVPFV